MPGHLSRCNRIYTFYQITFLAPVGQPGSPIQISCRHLRSPSKPSFLAALYTCSFIIPFARAFLHFVRIFLSSDTIPLSKCIKEL
ncbi:hypothetical protein RSAG8_04359, partial [Rhizoctonia solani AG-8 WAC10335]